MRLAVAGVGETGRRAVARLTAHPLVDLVAVCDSNTSVLDQVGSTAEVSTERCFDDLLANNALDAIVITTPARSHYPLVRKALDHDLSVFCASPLALSADESAELAELARDRGVQAQVGQHHRFIPSFTQGHDLVTGGRIGRIERVDVEVTTPSRRSMWPRFPGSRQRHLAQTAAPAVDLLTWFLGPAAPSVDSEGVALSFSGVSAALRLSSGDRPSIRMTFTGNHGELVVDEAEVSTTAGSIPATPVMPDPVEAAYNAELDHFIHAARGSLPLGADRQLNSFDAAATTAQALELLVTAQSARSLLSGVQQRSWVA